MEEVFAVHDVEDKRDVLKLFFNNGRQAHYSTKVEEGCTKRQVGIGITYVTYIPGASGGQESPQRQYGYCVLDNVCY